MKALIVDDSRAVRMVLGRMLKALGYVTTEAGDGAEALVKISTEGPFDLGLFDWNMPVMDGLQLLKSVRAQSNLKPMQVLMVTTETEAERINLALAEGANEYLMKPFTSDALAAKLELIKAAA